MYSKTAKSAHYLPRTGSYSTVPFRNGRVDVLPPNAQMQLYGIAQQIADGEVRISTLTKEKEKAEAELHSATGFDRLRAKHMSDYRPADGAHKARIRVTQIDAEIKAEKARLSELRAIASGSRKFSVESLFMKLAEAELPHDVYESLLKEAALIVRLSRGSK